MAWTNKIKNIVKGKIGNMVSGAIASKLSFASSGQTTKVAAKLLNKSPLEIGATGPLSHMESVNNPYQYGTVWYPNETSNLGAGHYIIFDIVSHKSSKFKQQSFQDGNLTASMTGSPTQMDKDNSKGMRSNIANIKRRGITQSSRLRSTSSGLVSKTGDTHNYISDSIILYTPAEAMKFNYSVGYEDTQTGLAGDLGQAIGSVMNASGWIDKLKTAGKKGGQLVGEVFKTAGFAAVGIIPGFENSRQTLDKALGQAKNQNLEMVFQSVPFRSFNFPFIFAPKDQSEKDQVHKILQLLRFHMLPEQSNGIQGGYFVTPSEFQITYMYRDSENSYIPRVSRCVLKTCNIDYAPEGVVSSLIPDEKGAPPTIIKMDLEFGETEIMTKHTVAEGF